MRLAELPAFETPSADFRAAVRDTALPLSGASEGFAGLFRQVHSEVADFIAHGADSDGGAAVALSAEGHAWQARLGTRIGGDVAAGNDEGATTAAQQAFLARIAPFANEAARALGVSPEVLSAQAALESAWGQRPVRGADGQDSHNLFGIKANAAWQGDAMQAMTSEFEGGQSVSRVDAFRAYSSDGESFRDLTGLLQRSPRYRAALNTGADARAYGEALMRGGYATDPAYADKLARIAARIQSGE
jgi:peptidoglycan hydrolase FlgJ